jgi:nucleoid-associated protein YgaU
MAEGETLTRVAAQELGDPAQWRRIADANGIDDPLAVAPGTVLEVPPIR